MTSIVHTLLVAHLLQSIGWDDATAVEDARWAVENRPARHVMLRRLWVVTKYGASSRIAPAMAARIILERIDAWDLERTARFFGAKPAPRVVPS